MAELALVDVEAYIYNSIESIKHATDSNLLRQAVVDAIRYKTQMTECIKMQKPASCAYTA